MTREAVLFRVDATPEVGYASLARCQILAAALQRRRRPAYFLSALQPGFLGMQLKRGGNDWLDADGLVGSSGDLDELIQEIRRIRPAAVVVDSPRASEEYLTAIRDAGVLLVHFDHIGSQCSPAHLLINPMLAPDKEVYEIFPGTQILMGARYALVRSGVRKCRAPRSQEPARLPTVKGKVGAGAYRALIALGEDDAHQQTLPLVQHMLNVPKIGRVDMIVRAHHPQMESLREFAEAHSSRVELAVETPEVQAKLVRCHFAVTSGSAWSLELAAVGIPQLLIVQNEHDWPNAQRLEEEGAATCLGWYESVSAGTIRNAVANLLGDKYERQAMSRCGRQLIDARGPDRLINALEIMLSPARNITLPTAA